MKKSVWVCSLLVLVLSLSMVACQSGSPGTMADPVNPCSTSGPSSNKNAPIVCVDDSNFPTIALDPPPATDVYLYTTKTIHWYTKSGAGTIAIAYDSTLLDPPVTKPREGHTKAKAKSQTGSVKYSIFVQKGNQASNVIDPTIIIDTCCSR